MPKLNEIIQERDNKKFVKKSYRPWDLTGDVAHVNQEKNDLQRPEKKLNIIDDKERTTSNNIQMLDTTNSASHELDIKLDTIKESIREQPDNIKITIGNHLDNTKETHQETIGKQLDINLDPTTAYHQLIKLAGVQKNILNFVVDISMVRKCFETGPIETSTIALYTKSSTGVVKISIKRLIDKGFISRNKGKQAKGGYINLSISEDIFNAVTEQRKKYNSISNSADLISSIRYQLDNESLYSSNSNIKTNTTKKAEQLPDEWQVINFDALSHIGFNKTQVKQLIDKSDPELVQESINHFAYGIEYNPKFQKYEDPLNVLMGVLRKGQGWFEKDYRSPKEIAQQQLFEWKRAEVERKKVQEDEAYKLALNEWQQTLTLIQITEIAPNKKMTGDITPQSAKLSLYFKEKIWPELKQEYLL